MIKLIIINNHNFLYNNKLSEFDYIPKINEIVTNFINFCIYP